LERCVVPICDLSHTQPEKVKDDLMTIPVVHASVRGADQADVAAPLTIL
jgi:hypothetical protein